jgi:hypothetical protein
MNTRIKTIERKIEGIAIYQRETDGYVNATQICKAHLEITGERKDTSNWLQTKMAQSAINKLSLVTGIPVTELIEVKQGGKYLAIPNSKLDSSENLTPRGLYNS